MAREIIPDNEFSVDAIPSAEHEDLISNKFL